MKKKEIIEIMVIKMKRELLFNYNFYPTMQTINTLCLKYIQKYPDSKNYQNMTRTILNTLHSEICTEKSSKMLFDEKEDYSNYDYIINVLENRKKFLGRRYI